MLDLVALSASALWWSRRLKVSITDLSVTVPNCVSVTTTVSSTALSALWPAAYSNIYDRIVKSEISRHNFVFVEPRPGLRFITYVACFEVFGKWQN